MTSPRKWSDRKSLLLLAGALLGGAVLLQLLETLAGGGSPDAAEQQAEADAFKPQLIRRDERTIEIKVGLLQGSTWRFDASDEIETIDAFWNCLQQGLDLEFTPERNAAEREGARRGPAERLRPIQHQCRDEVFDG